MKYLIGLFSLLFLTTTASAITATFKIGYVNMPHLISSSPQFSQANQTIVEEFQQQKDNIFNLEEKFKAAIQKFKKEQDSLSEADAQARLKILKSEEEILQDKAITLKDNLEKRKQEELDKVKAATDKAIKIIATKLKLDMVLHQNVAYVNENNNITTLVKKQLRSLFE